MSRHSDPTGALLLGTGAGIWTFFKGFRVFRELKIVADTPCMPIRSLPMGLVQVRGTARSEKLIPSPITHTPCCFYQVKIEHYKSNGVAGPGNTTAPTWMAPSSTCRIRPAKC